MIDFEEIKHPAIDAKEHAGKRLLALVSVLKSTTRFSLFTDRHADWKERWFVTQPCSWNRCRLADTLLVRAPLCDFISIVFRARFDRHYAFLRNARTLIKTSSSVVALFAKFDGIGLRLNRGYHCKRITYCRQEFIDLKYETPDDLVKFCEIEVIISRDGFSQV